MKDSLRFVSTILAAILCGAAFSACANEVKPPVTDVKTDAPITDAPATIDPVTDVTTDAYTTDAPVTTEAPETTEAPITETSDISTTTDAITTEGAETTDTPTTSPSTTAAPTTDAPSVTTETTSENDGVIVAPQNAFDYCIDKDGNVTILKYLGCEKNVIIPECIDGKPVTKIGELAFAKDVTLDYPPLVISIGRPNYRPTVTTEEADFPISITVSKFVTEIGESAFMGCPLEEVIIPSSVVSIGNKAFSACLSLKDVKLSNGLKHIGDSSFEYCESLKTLSLPDTVVSIGRSAFSQTGITNIVMPNSVTTLGAHAFSHCEQLCSVVLSSNIKTVSEFAFWNCINLCDVTMPHGIEIIERYAFVDCLSYTKIVLPDSVTHIYSGAFYRYNNTIEEVTLSDNLIYLAKYNFQEADWCLSENNAYYIGTRSNPHFCLLKLKSWDDENNTVTRITHGINAIHESTVLIAPEAIYNCTPDGLDLPDELRTIMPCAITQDSDFKITVPQNVKYFYEDSICGSLKIEFEDPEIEYSVYKNEYFDHKYYLGPIK